jgi:hypothetical protein
VLEEHASEFIRSLENHGASGFVLGEVVEGNGVSVTR